MHQLILGLKGTERIKLRSIEYDFIRIISVIQVIGISTVVKAWDCTQAVSTTVLGLRFRVLLGEAFLLNLFCSYTILVSMSEWSILGKPRIVVNSKCVPTTEFMYKPFSIDNIQFITAHQRSRGKVMFLHLIVILCTVGWCTISLPCWLPGPMLLLWGAPIKGVSPSERYGTHTPGSDIWWWPPKRAVCILPECILMLQFAVSYKTY